MKTNQDKIEELIFDDMEIMKDFYVASTKILKTARVRRHEEFPCLLKGDGGG